MSGLSRTIIKTIRPLAKGAGMAQSYFRRMHVAVLFEPAVQAAPVGRIIQTCLSPGAVKQRPRMQSDLSGRRFPQKLLLQVFINLCGFLLNT